MGCITSKEQVPKPRELSSLHRNVWLEWKKGFRAYMDYKRIPPCKRGEKLFKYIGFLGEHLSTKFYFANTAQETKYEVLLFKLDVYFIFSTNGLVVKADNQSCEDYVALLEIIAEKMGVKEITKTVKEKILQDFKAKNLFDRLKKLDFDSRIPNYENLVMHELLFLWKECDHLESIQANNSCKSCGKRHSPGKCYAKGKKCGKCEGANHFARCCWKTSVSNCDFCGSSHKIRMCPAFSKQCSKCKGQNHFSWMCKTEMIDNCIYCGGSHRSGRNYCSAKQSTCMTCTRKGHYTSQCFHRRK